MGNAFLYLLSTPPPCSPLEVIAALRMAAEISAESKKCSVVRSDGNKKMLINGGQAVADVPRLHEEAIQQSWVVYFLLSFPLVNALV